jgi:protease IV
MSLVINALVNLWRLLRNAGVRLLRHPPDYVWIEVSGSLLEFESRVGFLQRRLRPGPTGTSLERIREQLRRVSADGRPRGVVLRVRNLGAGWATLEEMCRELAALRRSA